MNIKKASLAATALWFASITAWSQTGDSFDPPPQFSVGDVVPESLREGPNHRIDDPVTNDGFMNTYVIDSDFGEFQIRGAPMLRIRLREVEALAELDRLSKTKIFADAAAEAAKNAITQPVETALSVATRPVDTIKGAPAGIKRLFQRQKRSVEKAVDTAQEVATDVGETVTGSDDDGENDGESEDLTAQAKEGAVGLSDSFLGVSTGERRWAKKLGTDPYTTNDVLKAAIKDVARIDRIGSMTTRMLVPIPSIPGMDVISEVNDAVWEMDSFELRQLNIGKLELMGVTESQAQAFLDNEIVTPSIQTLIVAMLEQMTDIAGRDQVIAQVALAESEEQARFHLMSLVTLTWAGSDKRPLQELLQTGAVTMARTDEGAILAALPLDHLTWNEVTAEAFSGWAALSGSPKLIFMAGDVSPLARQHIEAAGWTLETGLAQRLFDRLATH